MNRTPFVKPSRQITSQRRFTDPRELKVNKKWVGSATFGAEMLAPEFDMSTTTQGNVGSSEARCTTPAARRIPRDDNLRSTK
jgi:hypothetical protein